MPTAMPPFATAAVRRAYLAWPLAVVPLAVVVPGLHGDDSLIAAGGIPLAVDPDVEPASADSPAADPDADPSEPAADVDRTTVAPRTIHPQPNLRHATPGYEPVFAIPPGDVALLKVLEAPLPEGGIRLPEGATLRDLQGWVTQTYRVPLRIDHRALEDFGLDADSMLETRHIEGVTLGAALAAVLDELDLEATVRHESLLLTTREEAEARLISGVYPLPTQVIARRIEHLLDTIQSTIAADSWDIVGGSGAIRAAPEANALVISQTLPVHKEIIALLKVSFDADLEAGGEQAAAERPIRIHRIRDAAIAEDIASRLVAVCNGALGARGDPAASVTLLGDDRIVVQSASRPFHVYAAELIRGLDGVEETDTYGKPAPGFGPGF